MSGPRAGKPKNGFFYCDTWLQIFQNDSKICEAEVTVTPLINKICKPWLNLKEKLKNKITSAWNQTQDLWDPNGPEVYLYTSGFCGSNYNCTNLKHALSSRNLPQAIFIEKKWSYYFFGSYPMCFVFEHVWNSLDDSALNCMRMTVRNWRKINDFSHITGLIFSCKGVCCECCKLW